MGACNSQPEDAPKQANAQASLRQGTKKPPSKKGRKRGGSGGSTNSIGKEICGVTLEQRKTLEKETHFSLKEVDALCRQYELLSSSRDDDGVIDEGEWGDAFRKKVGETFIDNIPHMFVERMFRLFDRDGNGEIDLVEFIRGLSTFSKKGTQLEKVKFAFRLYDIDRDGSISQEELKAILIGCINEANQKTKSSSVTISPERLNTMVQQTFEEADTNGNGLIDFDEFENMVKSHPDIIANITFRASILEKSNSANTVR